VHHRSRHNSIFLLVRFLDALKQLVVSTYTIIPSILTASLSRPATTRDARIREQHRGNHAPEACPFSTTRQLVLEYRAVGSDEIVRRTVEQVVELARNHMQIPFCKDAVCQEKIAHCA